MISIVWPNQGVVRGPSSASEGSLKGILLRAGEQDCRGINLPQHRRNEIESAAATVGMRLAQAMSLRRQFYRRMEARQNKCTRPSGPGGNQKGQQSYALAFEEKVYAVVRFICDTCIILWGFLSLIVTNNLFL